MDTDVKIFSCESTQVTTSELLESGEYFSGSIYLGDAQDNYVIFNLVNKEKMKYILNEIDLNCEVKFEIQSYAEYPKNI